MQIWMNMTGRTYAHRHDRNKRIIFFHLFDYNNVQSSKKSIIRNTPVPKKTKTHLVETKTELAATEAHSCAQKGIRYSMTTAV